MNNAPELAVVIPKARDNSRRENDSRLKSISHFIVLTKHLTTSQYTMLLYYQAMCYCNAKKRIFIVLEIF